MHFCFFLLHTCMVDEYVAISCEVTRGLVFWGNRGQFVKEFIFWSGFCSTQELSGKLNGTVNIHTHIHTNIKPGLKYLYSLCSGFMEFGKYFIKGIYEEEVLYAELRNLLLWHVTVIVWTLGMKVLVLDVAWRFDISATM